jgi:hypothetical protein
MDHLESISQGLNRFTFTVILMLALGSAGRPASRAPVANYKVLVIDHVKNFPN